MQEEKKKGVPRKARRSRGKYDAYRRRKGSFGSREHPRRGKPSGVLRRFGPPPGCFVPATEAISCGKGQLS